MKDFNKQLERIVLQGPAKDIILYNANYFILEKIADNHQAINNSVYAKFFALIQKNSLDFLCLHLCRMYEKSNKHSSQTFFEISNFIRKNKNDLYIYNKAAADKFIEKEYDLKNDYILDSNDPVIDKKINTEISKSLASYFPDRIKNPVLDKHFNKLWKLRSKEIAHNDIEQVTDRPTFEGMRLLLDNAINIVNALTQIYFNAINMTPELELSLIEDSKHANVGLQNILDKILIPVTT